MTKVHQSMARLSLCAAISTLSVLPACGSEETPGPQHTAALISEPASPKIDSVSVSGPGCSTVGDHHIGISGTRSTFSVRFDAFVAESQAGGARAETECTITVVLEGADGISYAPAGFDLTVAASSAASVTTKGMWTTAPENMAEDVTSIARRGRHATRALDDEMLLSGCSGLRTLRFTTTVSVDGKAGSAEISQLGNLGFYARPCAEPDAGSAQDAATGGPNAELDAGAPSDAGALGGPDAGLTSTVDASPQAGAAASASIIDVTAAGVGCAAGTTQAEIGPDRDRFNVTFPSFSAATSSERPRRSSDCTLVVRLDLPAGKTVALDRFSVNGAATLATGESAVLTAYSGFTGSAEISPSKRIELQGPHTGPFASVHEFREDELLFRECGRNRNLVLTLGLSVRSVPGSAGAQASVSDVSSVGFVVRDCP